MDHDIITKMETTKIEEEKEKPPGREVDFLRSLHSECCRFMVVPQTAVWILSVIRSRDIGRWQLQPDAKLVVVLTTTRQFSLKLQKRWVDFLKHMKNSVCGTNSAETASVFSRVSLLSKTDQISTSIFDFLMFFPQGSLFMVSRGLIPEDQSIWVVFTQLRKSMVLIDVKLHPSSPNVWMLFVEYMACEHHNFIPFTLLTELHDHERTRKLCENTQRIYHTEAHNGCWCVLVA